MFARKLAVIVALLVAVPSAYGDFDASMWFADAAGNPLPVEWDETDTITVTVFNLQNYVGLATDPDPDGNLLTAINLNWWDTTPALYTQLTANPMASTWTWSATVDDGNDSHWDDFHRLTQGNGNEMIFPNGFLYRRGFLGTEYKEDPPGSGIWVLDNIVESIRPQPEDEPFPVGTLSFPAPDYIEGGDNNYVLSLKGGDGVVGTATYTEGLGEYAIAGDPPNPSFPDSLTLTDYSFGITPEPATLALMALGSGVALFIRRKR